jgi:hypothetical protein
VIAIDTGERQRILTISSWDISGTGPDPLYPLVEELLDFSAWLEQHPGFEDSEVFDPHTVRLNVAPAYYTDCPAWPLADMPPENGMIVSGDDVQEIQTLIDMGWFECYAYEGQNYAISYTPRYPYGWP